MKSQIVSPLSDDPVLAAFLAAPVSEEPETDEERTADLEAIADYRAGRGRRFNGSEVHADVEHLHDTAAE